MLLDLGSGCLALNRLLGQSCQHPQVMGGLRESVGKLQCMAKPGGFIVLDDAWRVETNRALPSLAVAYSIRDKARTELVAHGDEIVAEAIILIGTLRIENELNNTRIQQRVDVLSRRRPDCATQFCAYA